MKTLSATVQKALAAIGFKQLTDIQAAVLEPALAGRDFIARAPTGTGKTAAFVIPLVERMLKDPGLRAIVMEPSRELVIQAANESRKIAPAGMLVVAAYGGTPPQRQRELIAKGARIVVGTPGRLHELLNEGSLKPGLFHALVLDEADRLFQKEFSASVRHIASRLPKERQTMMFCVQMPAETLGHASGLLKDGFVQIKTGKTAAQTISHYYVVAENKASAVSKMLGKTPGKSIAFCSSAEAAGRLKSWLTRWGTRSILLHSELDSQKRHDAIRKFAAGDAQLLIATDLAARGLHFEGVKRIYSVDLPGKPEFYLHRAGRTGRMGHSGECVSIVTQGELKELKKILGQTGLEPTEMHVG